MQSFKLSGNYRVSKLFKEQSGKTRPKQQVKDRGLDRFSQHLSALAYVMCSSLIVYSLLTFNGLLADDATLSKANLLAKAAKPLALAGQEYLYNAWYILAEKTGRRRLPVTGNTVCVGKHDYNVILNVVRAPCNLEGVSEG